MAAWVVLNKEGGPPNVEVAGRDDNIEEGGVPKGVDALDWVVVNAEGERVKETGDGPEEPKDEGLPTIFAAGVDKDEPPNKLAPDAFNGVKSWLLLPKVGTASDDSTLSEELGTFDKMGGWLIVVAASGDTKLKTLGALAGIKDWPELLSFVPDVPNKLVPNIELPPPDDEELFWDTFDVTGTENKEIAGDFNGIDGLICLDPFTDL